MTRAAFLLALLLVAAPALARPPELRAVLGRPFPERLRQGESAAVHIVYSDPDGDRPQEAWLVLEGAGPVQRLPADLSGIEKSYRKGVPLAWTVGPLPAGRYRVHFEATSIDGQARYPREGDLTLLVESLLMKWLLLGVGVVVALGVLPGVVFVGARRAADPAGAARVGFSIGMLAAFVWFVWLFATTYAVTVFVLVGLAALGVGIWLIRRH